MRQSTREIPVGSTSSSDASAWIDMNAGVLGALTRQFYGFPVFITPALADALRQACNVSDAPEQWDPWWYDILFMSHHGIAGQSSPSHAYLDVSLGAIDAAHARRLRLSILLDAAGRQVVVFSLGLETPPEPHPTGVEIAGLRPDSVEKRRALLEAHGEFVTAALAGEADLHAVGLIIDLNDELGWAMARALFGPKEISAQQLLQHRFASNDAGSIPTVTTVLSETDARAMLKSSCLGFSEKLTQAQAADRRLLVVVSSYGKSFALVPRR